MVDGKLFELGAKIARRVFFTRPFNVTGQPAISLLLHWTRTASRSSVCRSNRPGGSADSGCVAAGTGATLAQSATAGTRLNETSNPQSGLKLTVRIARSKRQGTSL